MCKALLWAATDILLAQSIIKSYLGLIFTLPRSEMITTLWSTLATMVILVEIYLGAHQNKYKGDAKQMVMDKWIMYLAILLLALLATGVTIIVRPDDAATAIQEMKSVAKSAAGKFPPKEIGGVIGRLLKRAGAGGG